MRASRSGRGLSGNDRAPKPAAPPPITSGRPWLKYAILGGVVLSAVAGYFLVQHFRARSHFIAAEQALERRDFREAQERLEKCLAINPDDTSARLLAAQAARRGGKFEEAAAQLKVYREKNPGRNEDEREARFLRMQQGDMAEVDAGLSECLARQDAADPVALEAAISGGLKVLLSAFQQGETGPGGKAVPFLLRVQRGAELWLRLRPGKPDQAAGLVWRGLTRAYANDVVNSRVDFRASLELDPDQRDARYHLAMSLVQAAPSEAASHLERVLQRYPDDTHVKYSLATAYRDTGRTDDARRLLDEILALHPDNLGTLIERGSIAIDQGQLGDAEKWLLRAAALDPDDQQVNFALASCLRAAGRPAEAKTYQDRFLRAQEERKKRAEQAGQLPPTLPR